MAEFHIVHFDGGVYTIDCHRHIRTAPDARIIAAVKALKAAKVVGLLRIDGDGVEWVSVETKDAGADGTGVG